MDNPSLLRNEQIIAGSVITTVGVAGIACNLAAVVFIFYSPYFRNSYGLICVSNLLADVGILLIHALWAAPAEFFSFSVIFTESYVGRRIGQLILLFWYATVYSQLQIASNRLVAIVSPSTYSKVFTIRRTIYLLTGCWILSFFHIIILSWEECSFIFDVEQLIWYYSRSKCGEFVQFFLIFVHGCTICVAVVIIDAITFLAIFKHTKKLSKNGNCRETEKIIHKKNVRLFLQGCLTAFSFTVMLLSFHFLSSVAKTKWTIFVTTTIIWEVSHAVDGVIIFVLNDSFRETLKRRMSQVGSSVFIVSRRRVNNEEQTTELLLLSAIPAFQDSYLESSSVEGTILLIYLESSSVEGTILLNQAWHPGLQAVATTSINDSESKWSINMNLKRLRKFRCALDSIF